MVYRNSMRQVLQNLSDGETLLAEVPRPLLSAGQVLIRTSRSLVSAGTERMLLEFGRAGWLNKARQQPDKVMMVLNKARTDGVLSTVDAVRSKLDQPLPLGYCNAGVVVEVGHGVNGLAVGDRVISNGHHAEYVCVPKNLVAKIPEQVTNDEGAFTVLGAIGLQGIRLAQPTLGETFVVMGLGLIGLFTIQMLRAHGCQVIGLDFDPARLALAEAFGASVVDLSSTADPAQAAIAKNDGREVDAVLVTAATQKSEPISQAAHMCRKRGRIVLIGVTGLQLNRSDFFEKELTFQVSCSYGPGRYDSNYERTGLDYPIGFVRWTEQRNFEAVLRLFADGRLDVTPLITHRFAFSNAIDAYKALAEDRTSLGIVLEYSADPQPSQTVELPRARVPKPGGKRVTFLGAGNYSSRVLIPAFAKTGAAFATLVSAGGVSATHHGKKHEFARASTDVASSLEEPGVDAIVIATQHDQHAGHVLGALRAGKHVFCEKPLCLSLEELDEISREAYSRPDQILMVGFNRRFAPICAQALEVLETLVGPRAFIITVNAGAIPADHWTQDRKRGGGRIVGEACHFVDLLRYLCGQPISSAMATAVGHSGPAPTENATLTLTFADGSVGTIHYFATGNKAFPKERIEAFAGGTVLQIDNFRDLKVWGQKRRGPSSPLARLRQNKGQVEMVEKFVEAIRNGLPSPIPLEEVLESSRISIELAQALEGSRDKKASL